MQISYIHPPCSSYSFFPSEESQLHFHTYLYLFVYVAICSFLTSFFSGEDYISNSSAKEEQRQITRLQSQRWRSSVRVTSEEHLATVVLKFCIRIKTPRSCSLSLSLSSHTHIEEFSVFANHFAPTAHGTPVPISGDGFTRAQKSSRRQIYIFSFMTYRWRGVHTCHGRGNTHAHQPVPVTIAHFSNHRPKHDVNSWRLC